MKYITVNPTWNVPPSIINNEYLPALAQDPTVLDRMGLKMERNRDGSVHIYQPPGEANALGRIRFNFPNKFLVYQHDTPDKYLFAQDQRAFSHGCMRVQFPDKYAEVLLNIANPKDGYTADKIRRMYGTGERDIQLNDADPGAPDLPDRLRGRRRPSGDSRGHLWPRQPAAGGPEERRPADRGRAGRAPRSQQRRTTARRRRAMPAHSRPAPDLVLRVLPDYAITGS